MKPRFSNRKNDALTRTEVVIITAVATVLLCFMVLWWKKARQVNNLLQCNNNLKQIGLSFREWEGNHNDKFPMQVSMTNGGAMELIATGNVAGSFQVMSDELSTPFVLTCPSDTKHVATTHFGAGLDNSNISYFVGLDADDKYPQRILSGDDNFAIGGVPVKSGLLNLWTNAPVSWTAARHGFNGNICFSDGSVQEVTQSWLHQTLQQTGFATNRLAIP
jgi:prepilin-type processing-associated H-X9-DG protein